VLKKEKEVEEEDNDELFDKKNLYNNE